MARSISPTAARSVVGTSCTQSSGRPAAGQRAAQQLDDGARGMEAVGAAAQHHDVARLDAKRAGIGGDVGAGLVDHADDADRHAHAADHEPVRPRPFLDLGADRIGQGRDVVQALGHGLDARLVQQQAVLQRRRHAGGLGGGDVLGVGGEDRGLLARGSAGRPRRARGSWPRCRHCAGRRRRLSRAGRARPRSRRHPRQAWSERSSAAPVCLAGAHSTTRSSRWTISSRPRKPSRRSISALLRPAMRRASSAA